jgi:hypothetical protein
MGSKKTGIAGGRLLLSKRLRLPSRYQFGAETPPAKDQRSIKIEARTVWIAPGVHADFDREGRLIGIAVLDASERLGKTLSLEVSLALLPA